MQDTANEQNNPLILGNERINQAENCQECWTYVITHLRDFSLEFFSETNFFLINFKRYVE